MGLCSLCERIKEIRIKQGRPYYQDLCENCRREEMLRVVMKMGSKINGKKLKRNKINI